MSRIIVMLLALARALRPPLRATTRRVATQAVPINKGGKRGSRRQRHELRTLDFSEAPAPKPKARSKAHPGLEKLGAPTTPEATLKALQTNEIDAPTLAAGVASLCASQRRDLAIEAIQLRSLAKDPRSLTTAVTALCRAAAPKACVPLIDDVLGEGVARPGRIYGPIIAGLLDKRRRPYDLLRDWVQAEASTSENCEPPSHIPFARALEACRRSKDLDAAYLVLDAFASSKCEDHADLSREISSIFARSVRFIVGAVSSKQLPSTDVKEVAFVGRSNVGKRSLVNMFLGRTKAAYVSKKPGKTRQFNVFDVNSASVDSRRASSVVEESSPWSPSGRFRLVDVPGSGYAKVSESYRDEWKVFLAEYLSTRDNLQAVCHLVDSRVGLQKTDLELFELIGESGFAGDVIIVLTKVDKKSARAAEVLAAVRQAAPAARVVSTSSKEGIGRAALWRALRGVVVPEEAS